MTSRIIPKYSSDAINTPIDLGCSDVELSHNGATVKGYGCAQLHLGLQERVIVSVEIEPTFHGIMIGYSKDDLTLRLAGSARPTAVISIQTRTTNDKCELQLLAKSGTFELCRDRRIRLKSALLHLLNFPQFMSASTDLVHEEDGTLRKLGRVILTHDQWEIEIQELPQTGKLIKELKKSGGNAVTHILQLIRTDGQSFSISALQRVINDLHRFLSFARGQWTSVFGPVGYDRKGEIAYESWGSLLSAPWQSRSSWFDVHHGECLSAAYSGFVKILHDPQLGSAISAALYWYLRSNRAGDGAGIDSGLILSQAALERLSVTVLSVNHLPIPKTAAEKIRAACQYLLIPVALPKHFKSLQKAKRAGDITDVPDAIVRLRNELVHPNRRMKSAIAPLVYPSWQLAQWYIELSILKLSGYQGVYSNRLKAKWVGEVERMP